MSIDKYTALSTEANNQVEARSKLIGERTAALMRGDNKTASRLNESIRQHSSEIARLRFAAKESLK